MPPKRKTRQTKNSKAAKTRLPQQAPQNVVNRRAGTRSNPSSTQANEEIPLRQQQQTGPVALTQHALEALTKSPEDMTVKDEEQEEYTVKDSNNCPPKFYHDGEVLVHMDPLETNCLPWLLQYPISPT